MLPGNESAMGTQLPPNGEKMRGLENGSVTNTMLDKR